MTPIDENQPRPTIGSFGYTPGKDRYHSLSLEQELGNKLIKLTYSRLLLLFVIGSIAGLAIEVIYHFIVFGEYESRVGLVWGPFSPLYGFGAIALTIALNRLWRLNHFFLFGTSMIIGSAIEFIASWGMECLFGAVAWDYSGTFMSIQGRVNLMFACMWGVLGLAWVRIVMPLMDEGFKGINWKNPLIKATSMVMTAFLTVNIVVTLQALDRESERAVGLPAISQIDHFYDKYFPTEVMKTKFANMSIYGTTDE